MSKLSPDAQAEIKEEAIEWETELRRLQALLPTELTRDSLKKQDIPQLEERLQQTEASIIGSLTSKNAVCAVALYFLIDFTLKFPHRLRKSLRKPVKS